MLSAQQVVDRYFLDTRCMLIEIAAMLDRYDRASAGEGEGVPPPGLDKIREALRLLADPRGGPDRAERVLRLFSDTAGLDD